MEIASFYPETFNFTENYKRYIKNLDALMSSLQVEEIEVAISLKVQISGSVLLKRAYEVVC